MAAKQRRQRCFKDLEGSYPGKIAGKHWNKKALEGYMKCISEFQEANKIPSSRILVGEFGGYGKQKGLPNYFKDLTSIFREHGWHWAFYAFREDHWDGMDYELGDKKLPWSYWKSIEKGEIPRVKRKDTYSQFKILKKALCP